MQSCHCPHKAKDSALIPLERSSFPQKYPGGPELLSSLPVPSEEGNFLPEWSSQELKMNKASYKAQGTRGILEVTGTTGGGLFLKPQCLESEVEGIRVSGHLSGFLNEMPSQNRGWDWRKCKPLHRSHVSVQVQVSAWG